ncbi:hypothetical protein Pelo_4945 [Pelomyxa schiedti]|nr:hypothetical protein Pelo_4945 [Pelomyxa schiedti]
MCDNRNNHVGPLFPAAMLPNLRNMDRGEADHHFDFAVPDFLRPPRLWDATLQHYVQNDAERLYRWDRRRPDVVFQHGLAPRVTDETPAPAAYDLRTYVNSNAPSVFVGTTRCYRNDHGIICFWMPRDRADVFLYEIFAPGGIDVNGVLGQHQYENQREIVFAGGIEREYIRSAREYDANRRITRVWLNPNFHPNVPLDSLPLLRTSANITTSEWQPPRDNARLGLRDQIYDFSDFEEFMHSPAGDGCADPFECSDSYEVTAVDRCQHKKIAVIFCNRWGGDITNISLVFTPGTNALPVCAYHFPSLAENEKTMELLRYYAIGVGSGSWDYWYVTFDSEGMRWQTNKRNFACSITSACDGRPLWFWVCRSGGSAYCETGFPFSGVELHKDY